VRLYDNTDHRQCSAADAQGLDCAGPEGHEDPHANANGQWPMREADHEWRWEPDGNGGWISAPRCYEPTCPDFGSWDFGEGTCPAEHAEPPAEVVHLMREGYGTTRCCFRTPFELPSEHRMTVDPDAFTCAGVAAAEHQARLAAEPKETP
jgi:hypothetical protein